MKMSENIGYFCSSGDSTAYYLIEVDVDRIKILSIFKEWSDEAACHRVLPLPVRRRLTLPEKKATIYLALRRSQKPLKSLLLKSLFFWFSKRAQPLKSTIKRQTNETF